MTISDVIEAIAELTRISPETQGDLLASLIITLVLWIVRAIVVGIVYRRTEDVQARYRWRKATTYTAVVVGIFLISRIWFAGFGSLATYLGILSAGLTIALSDLVADFAGWVFIISRKPFRVGDRVQIDNAAGDVIDIRPFQFSLMEIGNWVEADQSTGRVIHVPNGKVLREPLQNYSAGFPYIWNEIPVLITFESNWQDAKEIFLDIEARQAAHVTDDAQRHVREASKQYMIFYRKLSPTVYTSVRDSGVLLTLRYLCEIRNRRGSEQAIWEEILTEFARRDDIDFAYPTRRYYDNAAEGKAGTRPQALEVDLASDG